MKRTFPLNNRRRATVVERRSFLASLATTALATSNRVAGSSKKLPAAPVASHKSSIQGAHDLDEKLRRISEMLEAYLLEHFFDEDGILYAYIDVETGKPFTSEFMSTQYLDMFHVPDPVHYWSNEDSMQYSGYLLAALYEKYMATRESQVLEQMNDIYLGIRKVYELSQSIEPNSFSRPYGGLQNMAKYRECLGTDQAQSLFWGLWLFAQVAGQRIRSQIDEMNLRTLEWYRRQNYSYLYYKMIVHGSRGDDMRDLGHSLCHYLPCLLWAREVTGDVSYYNDYVSLWEEQWFECYRRRMNFSWKHRHNLRWLKDLAPEQSFWQKFLERCNDLDLSLFNGTDPLTGANEHGEDSFHWLFPLIDQDGFCHEWRRAGEKGFKTGITQEQEEWLSGWRSASREEKAQLLNLMKDRRGWFPGEKRNLYRHKAKFIPVSKIKDITMAIMYDHSFTEHIQKAKELLAKYDTIDLFTWVIDPDHQLIPEESIHFYPRSVSSGLISFWLLGYWTLQRVENPKFHRF